MGDRHARHQPRRRPDGARGRARRAGRRALGRAPVAGGGPADRGARRGLSAAPSSSSRGASRSSPQGEVALWHQIPCPLLQAGSLDHWLAAWSCPAPAGFDQPAEAGRSRARAERRPGGTRPAIRRYGMCARGVGPRPARLLLDAYERHGPVFTLRILHATRSSCSGRRPTTASWSRTPATSRWRDGGFGDLIPLLGDGLLTIDGDFHRRSRRIMLPAFHRERIAAAPDAMEDEIDRALAPWRAGRRRRPLRLDARAGAARGHARAVRLRPRRRPRRPRPRARVRARARLLRPRLRLQVLRGPGTPWARAAARARRLDALIYGEIARRRRTASAARTCSRCCSTPRTRTATGSATGTCATRS